MVCAPCGSARASLLAGMYLQNYRSCLTEMSLDARQSNIALEALVMRYDPVLFGYTDTSCDPRKTPQEELTRFVYEGVLPVFRAEILLVDYLIPWI
jgi:hypothetical protein